LLEESDCLIGTGDIIVSVENSALLSEVRKDNFFVFNGRLFNAGNVFGFRRSNTHFGEVQQSEFSLLLLKVFRLFSCCE
jgi:hypothetical protein